METAVAADGVWEIGFRVYSMIYSKIHASCYVGDLHIFHTTHREGATVAVFNKG